MVEDGGLTIGRGVDNDVIISDLAASRQHAIVQVRDGSYFLADLGSGNGTRVNGRRIDEVPLKGGEEIEIGTVRCHFVIPSAKNGQPHVFTPKKKSGSMAKALLALSLVLLLAIGIGLVVKFGMKKGWFGKRGNTGVTELARKNDSGTAKKFFDQGVVKFREKEWKEALNKFQVAAQLDPRFPNIDKYLQRCKEEEDNARWFEEGKAAFKKRDLRKAREFLSKVTLESVYRTDAQQFLARTEDALVDQMLKKAEQILDANPSEALKLAKEVIEIMPTNTRAFNIQTKAEDRLDKKGTRVAAVERPSSTNRSWHPRRHYRPKSKVETRPVKTEKNTEEEAPGQSSATGGIADGLRLFDQKKFSDAIAFMNNLSRSSRRRATRRKASKLVKKLKAFNAAWNSGTNQLKKRSFGGAIRAFEKALRIGKTIKSSSPIIDEVKKRLAPSYVLYGNASLKNTKYSEAYQSFKKALKYRPGYTLAKRGMQQLASKAKKLYYEGYVAKYSDPDTAKKKWRIVVQITPPDNEWHQKAEKRLEE
ncbi:MAG: FHA domain-containing protein [Deltaproteobacteria bacterium]|nr:FHA domain-containing protein [Deltaproteobacteria bacterium]